MGKSVVFSSLTGKEVLAANYAGTTVTFTQGVVRLSGREADLIDVPGTYSLVPTSPAEEVAVELVKEGADVIICVLDATNLERNLNLALQIRYLGVPVVYALNLVDVADRQGLSIDVGLLSRELEGPVVPTVAVVNKGMNDLLKAAWDAYEQTPRVAGGVLIRPIEQKELWTEAERIARTVQRTEKKPASFWDRVGHLTMQPFPGLPIALVVMVLSLAVVVGGGKALRSVVLLPLINGLIVPALKSVVSLVVTEGIIFNVLVGEYGVLVKGIEWPFALILPYVILFYVVLSFLEDSGYLPRLGVLMDGTLRRVGIPGGNVVPFIMGYGCAVPAILGTRASTNYKERLVVASLVSLAVPCAAQSGAFVALLGARSALALGLVYMTSFTALLIAGLSLNRVIPGKR